MNDERIRVVEPVPQYDETLRQWLEKFIKDHPHLSTKELSRSHHIGVTRSYLDAYLERKIFLSKEQGGYGVKNSKIEDQIRAFRERVEGTERHGSQAGFVKTRTFTVLQQAIQTAIRRNVIVVAYGPPGVGKTKCLTEFSVSNLQTPPISILCSMNITVRDFVEQIAGELNLDTRASTAKLERVVAEKLRRAPRILFIDQANYLNEKALGSICFWWDKARVPIVLVGTALLYENFMTSRLTEDVRAQLSRRVAVSYPLPSLEIEEAKSIITRALGQDATDENVTLIFNLTGGLFGNLDNLFDYFYDVKKLNERKLKAGDVTIEKVIRTAATKLMIA